MDTLVKVGIPAALILWRALQSVRAWLGSKRAPLTAEFWLPVVVLAAFTAVRLAVYSHTHVLDPFEVIKMPATKENFSIVKGIAQMQLAGVDFSRSLDYLEDHDIALWASVGSALTRCPYNDGDSRNYLSMAVPPVLLRASTYVLQVLVMTRVSETCRRLQRGLLWFALITGAFDISLTLLPASLFFFRTNVLRASEVMLALTSATWVGLEVRCLAPNRQSALAVVHRVRTQLAVQNRHNIAARDALDAVARAPDLTATWLQHARARGGPAEDPDKERPFDVRPYEDHYVLTEV